ncbi:hypothetical protein Ddye_001112 [Dipteronia dyeriana]|uniref:Uncharacterized protein n=1 Tax=Dipteronia dyeriana TaxID=168575 RepID=A0AAD9XNJ8_9ROSI|nr:hypothetical protein Ddye_001112 [Dipteronia dyeriana]
MVHAIRKRRKTVGEETISDKGGTKSSTGSKLKLDNMAWINFHKQECQITNPGGKKKSMHEIRTTWTNLSREEKSQYTMHKNGVVEDKFRVGDTYKENMTLPFHTRCTLTQFSQMMATFSDLQKDVVRDLGFGNLLMLNYGFLR